MQSANLICFHKYWSGADPGVVRSNPHKVKQKDNFYHILFLAKRGLVKRQQQLDNVGGRLSEPPFTKSWILPRLITERVGWHEVLLQIYCCRSVSEGSIHIQVNEKFIFISVSCRFPYLIGSSSKERVSGRRNNKQRVAWTNQAAPSLCSVSRQVVKHIRAQAKKRFWNALSDLILITQFIRLVFGNEKKYFVRSH